MSTTVFLHPPVGLELNLKTGIATKRFGPVLFLLWRVPPVANGEPFGLYEQVMNPAHPGTLNLLRRAARRTHLYVVVLGPGGKPIDCLEYENNFGFEESVPVVEATGHLRQARIRANLRSHATVRLGVRPKSEIRISEATAILLRKPVVSTRCGKIRRYCAAVPGRMPFQRTDGKLLRVFLA